MRIPHIPFLSIILCYYFWIYHSVHFSVVSAQIVGDQQLLLKLKNNLKFEREKSRKLVSWNPSSGCCEWRGVTCDKEGQVIGLDLSEESIYGGFDNSSSLFSLQNLQSLNLATNNFNSVIPFGFNKLKNLTYLNLSYAGFVGKVPVELSHLTRLVTFDISSLSYLNGQQLKLEYLDLRKLVQNLTGIRQLYMDGVSVNSQGHEWCNALLVLPSLQELSMSNCNLSGPLDPSLAILGNLSVIRLDHNNLSSPVPETFAHFQNLTTLHLSSCGLTGTFPEKIFRLATLSDIDISFNYDLNGSFPEFPLHGSLRTLIVSHTSFVGAIPASISNLRQLSILDLSNCQFHRTLPSSMSRLGELTYLQLSVNNFIGSIPSLNLSKNLMHLDLSHNDLEGPIPNFIFRLRSLKVLQLSSNNLIGTLKLDIIQRLANLTTLDLSYNKLSIDTNVTDVGLISSLAKMSNVGLASCNLTEFPSFLRNQSQIRTLDLSSNLIRGAIPTWIWQLDSLVQLNLSHNLLSNLEAPVQNTSSTLKVLDLHSNQLKDVGTYLPPIIVLSLSKNNLSGSIPLSLCNQPKLLVLDVSYNHFNGTIPECLTQSKTLVALSLKHNKLHGNIPDTFPVSCSLKTLDLNGNLLRAPMPNSLVNCTSLEVLDLGNNQIHDGFPCFLKTLPRLLVMILRENEFQGPIECPEIKDSWHMLQVVDLAFNYFNGFLPGKLFKTLEAMAFFQHPATFAINGLQREFVFTSVDFSFNNFQGPLPKELMNLTGLHVLNLSNNALTGQIPSSIGNLKQLESLDLSSNCFDGEIPAELANLTSLSCLNLSFNQLVGKIPTDKQLLTFDADSFAGNEDLCGPPLIKICSDGVHERLHLNYSIHLNILSVGLGLILGIGLVFFPLLFWKQWKHWYWTRVDTILCCIFPQLILAYERHGGQRYRVLRWIH